MPIKESVSSDQFQPPAAGNAPEETSHEEIDALAADVPLPESYGSDAVSLLVQSPERIYLYWHHSRPPAATLRQAFGNGAESYRPAVRLIDVESGEVSSYEASDSCAQWFEVGAGRAYRAEIGFAAPERPFVRVLSSGVARTPSRSVSPSTDAAAEFRIRPESFARLLSQAGYAEDASEVERQAASTEAGRAADFERSRLAPAEESSDFASGPNWKASDVNSGARTSASRLRADRSELF